MGKEDGGVGGAFSPNYKSCQSNNERGEWCVSREALSRVSVFAGARDGGESGRRARRRGDGIPMRARKTGTTRSGFR